jgi:uncharacterized protein
MFRHLSNKRFGIQLLSLLGLCFVGVFLINIVSGLLVMYMQKGSSFADAAKIDFTDIKNIKLFKMLMPVQTILLFGVPAILFSAMAHRNANAFIGFRTIKNPMHILLGIAAILTGLYFVNLLAEWNKLLPLPQSWIDVEVKYAGLTKAFLQMDTPSHLMINLLSIALLPAICEELLFRGCLQNMLIQHLGKHNAGLAILITGIVFGIIHGQMQTVLPRIFLGIVLGYIYLYSNSIWPSMVGHFVNNGLQICLVYMANKNMIDAGIVKDDVQIPMMYGLLSGAICIALLGAMAKSRQVYQILVSDSSNEQQDNFY